jgi:hypothetical protein
LKSIKSSKEEYDVLGRRITLSNQQEAINYPPFATQVAQFKWETKQAKSLELQKKMNRFSI